MKKRDIHVKKRPTKKEIEKISEIYFEIKNDPVAMKQAMKIATC